MVLDTIGKGNSTSNWPQNALLTVDRTAKTLTATPAYYVFRHFSQYVTPGAKRVATTGTAVDTLAFKNPDGSIVAIMYNAGTAARTTTVAIGTARLQFSIPASGFATIRRYVLARERESGRVRGRYFTSTTSYFCLPSCSIGW